MDCRLALAQTNPRLGDLHHNLEDHLVRIDAARAEGAQVIAFPELSLSGYFLKDQVDELAQARDSALFEPLVERSKHLSIAFGFVERDDSGRLYNSVGWLEDGEMIGVHRKVHLVSYGLFDETRDFAAGERFEVIESKHGRIGPLICEDLWHAPSAYQHFLNDADLMLVASASPARGVEASGEGLASQRTWDTLLKATALFYRSYVAYAGRVGWEDGIGFGGASSLFGPGGDLLGRLEGLEPGLLTTALEAAALRRSRVETPLRRDEKPWILAAELARHVPVLSAAVEEARARDDG